MKRILLIRHTKTTDPTRFYGSTDINLSQRGHEQAKLLSQKLLNENIEAVYSSSLYRTIYPARLVSEQGKIKHIIQPKLKEIDFGQWEGLTFDEIQQRDETGVNKWIKDPLKFVFPEGEAIKSFIKRVTKCLKTIEKNNHLDTVAIITHGGVIRILLCELLKRPVKEMWEIPQDFGAINILEYSNGHKTVQKINDTDYLLNNR